MKFLEEHHADILACFAKAKLTKAQFSFRKKRGRIYIDHLESKAWFAYHSKDLSYIDLATKQRIVSVTWEVNTPSKRNIKVDTWRNVLRHLVVWLYQME